MDIKRYLPHQDDDKTDSKMVRLSAEHHKKLRMMASENECTMTDFTGALIDMAFEAKGIQ